MERNANYAIVGLATLILTIALIVFSVWLGRIWFTRENDLYDILFIGPVRGLVEGGEVQFNGIKVGEVTRLELDPRDTKRVIARIRIASDVPIRVDSFATLEPQGITGLNYVQITAGTPTKKLLVDVTPKNQIPVIHSQRSALSDLLEGGGTVLSRAIEALDRVNRILSDENIKTFSTALNDTQAVTAELKAKKQIFGDAQIAVQNAGQAAAEFAELGRSGRALVDGDGKRTLANLASAAEEAKKAAEDARKMIDSLQGPTSDFANNGLPQVTEAVVSLQEAAEALERLVNDIERNPRDLVSKPVAKEVEVKP
jgi:phospholipid/cholesterol/gamma-HCH transport system substrate-binding protein